MSYQLSFPQDGALDAYRDLMTNLVETAVTMSAERLDLARLAQVHVVADQALVIPATGFGGYAETSAELWVYCDPEQRDFESAIRRHLARTVAHELHHCARLASFAYESLREKVVAEGLADRFDIEVNRGEPYPWSAALTQDEVAGLLERFEEACADASTDHDGWLFGSQERGIPRWAGYAIGFHVAGEHMRRTGRTAAELAVAPAEDFF